ncbi:MAG: hypothetical protein I8H75_04575 [Myxococcaceae bacterium]|nr:hypothetical protein [Myxococcaceae bacterium]MBH2006598.1 hypothetical protein [Myxococcaceae bacterium]
MRSLLLFTLALSAPIFSKGLLSEAWKKALKSNQAAGSSSETQPNKTPKPLSEIQQVLAQLKRIAERPGALADQKACVNRQIEIVERLAQMVQTAYDRLQEATRINDFENMALYQAKLKAVHKKAANAILESSACFGATAQQNAAEESPEEAALRDNTTVTDFSAITVNTPGQAVVLDENPASPSQ